MNDLAKLHSFLFSKTYEDSKSVRDQPEIAAPFITISRQAGAGGNSLADAIINEFQENKTALFSDWQRFNQEICHKAAEDPKLTVLLEKLIKYEYRPPLEDVFTELIAGTTPQDTVNRQIFKMVRSLASLGKVILVGRGGVCLTRDLPMGVHIRLVAPLKKRVDRIAVLYGLSEKKAKEFIQEQDKCRAKLVKNYFGKNIDDPMLYDAIWNTGYVPVNEIAAAVCKLVEVKAVAALERSP